MIHQCGPDCHNLTCWMNRQMEELFTAHNVREYLPVYYLLQDGPAVMIDLIGVLGPDKKLQGVMWSNRVTRQKDLIKAFSIN